MPGYVIGIDQSTQGTKALLIDENGRLTARADRQHRQIINELGWVEHDPEEILDNTLRVCADLLEKAGIDSSEIICIGISNQRETSLVWDRITGKPAYNAIVWQCARAAEICDRREIREKAEQIRQITGIRLSPYFPAAKIKWIMENIPEASGLAAKNRMACGTIDSWLVFNLTGNHKTDYSNASRTQLFDIENLEWSEDLCRLFGIPLEALPEVCMSDSVFGMTDLKGVLDHEVPVCGVMGDSHGALFGQGCRMPGQIKTTYGTGSSVMMNTGAEIVRSKSGLVTSIAWGMNGKVGYVLEGNLNYTGAVMTWLRNDVGLITTDAEATDLALAAKPEDRSYFVPAFTGLGAPYWDSYATGMLTGITRTTGRAEIARACLDCIAYQITDLVECMRNDSGLPVDSMRADGGPTASSYLMQFQSDMAQLTVEVPELQELSGIGAAYCAGISAGVYDNSIFDSIRRSRYNTIMNNEERESRYNGWKDAVRRTLM